MSKYIKKPIPIEAVQFTGDLDALRGTFLVDYLRRNVIYTQQSISPTDSRVNTRLLIKTLEGVMNVSVGDYIIKGVRGEIYPCKPDIFEESYQSYNEQLDTFQGRLKKETEEIANRLNKLNTFMGTRKFYKLPIEDKVLLYRQQRTMSELVEVLGMRCNLHEISLDIEFIDSSGDVK